MGKIAEVAGSRWCAADCKGEDVFVGDVVMDSYGDEVRVDAMRLDGGLVWLVAGGRDMVPGLVRRCSR